MSKYVDEIVKDIRSNPLDWTYFSHGLRKGEIVISNVTTGPLFTICELRIGDPAIITYLDQFKLESAVRWWCKNCPLEHIAKQE